MRKDVATTSNQNAANVPLLRSKRSSFFSPWANDLWEPDYLLDTFFGPDLSPFSNENRFISPAIDVDETATEYMVSADLPGINKDDIAIDCSGNMLTISAERKYENKDEKKTGRRERFYGSYQRSFTLPVGVDANKIDASYDNGVLTVHIPKGESVKTKRIAIGGKETKAKH